MARHEDTVVMLSAAKHLDPPVRSFAALSMTRGEEDDKRGGSFG